MPSSLGGPAQGKRSDKNNHIMDFFVHKAFVAETRGEGVSLRVRAMAGVARRGADG
jgi:hypothetical protein